MEDQPNSLSDPIQTFIEEYRSNRELLNQRLDPPKMMPLTEKSTKKLEVKNLTTVLDKRDFDL